MGDAGGWQASLPADKRELVINHFLGKMRSLGPGGAFEPDRELNAVQFEADAFSNSVNKDDYLTKIANAISHAQNAHGQRRPDKPMPPPPSTAAGPADPAERTKRPRLPMQSGGGNGGQPTDGGHGVPNGVPISMPNGAHHGAPNGVHPNGVLSGAQGGAPNGFGGVPNGIPNADGANREYPTAYPNAYPSVNAPNGVPNGFVPNGVNVPPPTPTPDWRASLSGLERVQICQHTLGVLWQLYPRAQKEGIRGTTSNLEYRAYRKANDRHEYVRIVASSLKDIRGKAAAHHRAVAARRFHRGAPPPPSLLPAPMQAVISAVQPATSLPALRPAVPMFAHMSLPMSVPMSAPIPAPMSAPMSASMSVHMPGKGAQPQRRSPSSTIAGATDPTSPAAVDHHRPWL